MIASPVQAQLLLVRRQLGWDEDNANRNDVGQDVVDDALGALSSYSSPQSFDSDGVEDGGREVKGIQSGGGGKWKEEGVGIREAEILACCEEQRSVLELAKTLLADCCSALSREISSFLFHHHPPFLYLLPHSLDHPLPHTNMLEHTLIQLIQSPAWIVSHSRTHKLIIGLSREGGAQRDAR